MALKFYMTPGSCSTGIHILLETLELPFEAWIINIPAGEHLRPEYLKINPRGKIPTLVLDDGRALTDFKSIALWLAETYPRGKLLPDDPAQAERAIELLDFALIQLHGEGYTQIFTSERYISSSEAQQGQHLKDDVGSHGREIVRQAFGISREAHAGRRLRSGTAVLDCRRGPVLQRVLGRQDWHLVAAACHCALPARACAACHAPGACRRRVSILTPRDRDSLTPATARRLEKACL